MKPSLSQHPVKILKVVILTMTLWVLYACGSIISHGDQGGGGTQGVAIEIPDSLSQQTFHYRLWTKVDTGYALMSIGKVQSGDTLEIPKQGGLEVTTSDAKRIYYQPAESLWVHSDSTTKLRLDTWDRPVIRKIRSHKSIALRLASSPYANKADDSGLISLHQVPSERLIAEYQSTTTPNQKPGTFMLLDSSIQTFIPPKILENPTQLPKYWKWPWIADSTQLTQDSSWIWINGTPRWNQVGWRMDTSSPMRIVHGIPSTGNNRVNKYTVIMDLQLENNNWWNPIFSPYNLQGNRVLITLGMDRCLSEETVYGKSPFPIQTDTWQRFVMTFDADNKAHYQVWVDGLRVWDRNIPLPSGYTSWSEVPTNVYPHLSMESNAEGFGVLYLFTRGANFKPNSTIRALGIYPGIMSDSAIAELGGYKP